MGGIVETQPKRFRALVDPIVAATRSFGLPAPPETTIGIALLSRGGVVLYEYGQLTGAAGAAGPELWATLDQTSLVDNDDATAGAATAADPSRSAGAAEIAGRRFVVWKHDRSLRFYGASKDRTWGLFCRKLSIGMLVVVHTKALLAQTFLPELERFCDHFQT